MKNNFLNIFSKFKSSTVFSRSRRVNLHWRIILAIFIPLNIAAGVLAVHYFSLINAGEFVINYPQSNQKFSSVDVKELGNIVTTFEQKNLNLKNWDKSLSTVVDPTL